MSLFSDELAPVHIERVNAEVRQMFKFLRADKEKVSKSFMTPFESIDIELAWKEFDVLAYNAIFKETGGDMELLDSGPTRARIVTNIFQRWPIVYYTKLLQRRGLMSKIDNDHGDTYYFKSIYKDSINTRSKASSTGSGM